MKVKKKSTLFWYLTSALRLNAAQKFSHRFIICIANDFNDNKKYIKHIN